MTSERGDGGKQNRDDKNHVLLFSITYLASVTYPTVKPEVVHLVDEEPISIGETHHMCMPIQISSDEDERISVSITVSTMVYYNLQNVLLFMQNQVLIHELCSSTRITCISVVKGR